MDGDAKRELAARKAAESADAASVYNAYSAANSEFVNGQASLQSQLRREQDVALSSLSGSLTRVGEMAKAIDVEVREQDALIEDIDKGVTEAQGKMDNAIARIQKILKTQSNCQLVTIIALVLIFIVVGIVAFYMLTK